MVKIPNGYIFFARKIKQSDIWLKKPSWWLKVWGYILMEVNHAKNKEFPRGQNFFTREQIYYNCKLNLDKIKVETVDNVIRWLRATTQITTRKTTRGIIITVCNYNAYQNSKNYKDETVDETVDETKTRQKRDKNDTINKNDKNDKNLKEKYKEKFLELWNKYPNKDGQIEAEKHFNASIKRKKDWQDINIALKNYLESERVKNGYVKNGSTWFNNWRDWINYKEPLKPSKSQQSKKGELEEL